MLVEMTERGRYDESGRDYDAINARIRRVQALREGGRVQRLHTVPIIGDASVAAHSFNMALLLAILMPDYPGRLMEAVLTHDLAERWVGDTPAPAKYTIHPPLGEELKKAEEVVDKALGIGIELSEFERGWLKALDILELLMFCEDQLALGNRNVELTAKNCRIILDADWVPNRVREFAMCYEWERTADVVGGETMGEMTLEQFNDN